MWHAGGMAGEDDGGSHVAATITSSVQGEARRGDHLRHRQAFEGRNAA